MIRFRLPLALQLVLWFYMISIVPVVLVYTFMQGQMRDAYLGARLDTLEN